MNSEVRDALAVIIHTPHIKSYLEMNDPKALNQVRAALDLCDIQFYALVNVDTGMVVPNTAEQKLTHTEATQRNKDLLTGKFKVAWCESSRIVAGHVVRPPQR